MMMVLLALELEAIKYETYMVKKKKKAFCTVIWRETVDLCPKTKDSKIGVCVCVNKSRSQFFDKGKRNYTLLFFSYFGREQQLITRTGATDYCSRHVIL